MSSYTRSATRSGTSKRSSLNRDFPMAPQPKSMLRPKVWTDEVEEAYRFQLAGYRDAVEYSAVKGQQPDRWPESGYIKKLQRRDGTFYYYNRCRECPDKDVHRTKIYAY